MKNVRTIIFPVLMVTGLVISAFVIVMAIQAAPGFSAPSEGKPAVALVSHESLAQQGQALFVAKGCMVCHRNDRAAGARETTFEFSDVPNLTHVKIDEAYLRRWLRDPKSIKPNTEMPQLNLSDAEIDALVAFLKSE